MPQRPKTPPNGRFRDRNAVTGRVYHLRNAVEARIAETRPAMTQLQRPLPDPPS